MSDAARPFTIALDARELATVIAALKWWKYDDTGEDGWEACDDIAKSAGAPMKDAEIDDLAERFNAASAPTVTA